MEPSDTTTAVKRKRSPSSASQASSAPVPKATKTGPSQLSINYLARQSPDDLPLINKEDSLPSLLHLLASYTNILDRHESLASNLGARPLGPILIKRFERCFDAPPKVVASHHKASSNNSEDNPLITWLEVIEFARSHPSQFTLSTFSEGKRVCQFYYPQKQFRVQISEEDFLFINSGRCQELIPPLPIWEDEEKEVATCDVLEAKLKELTNAADMVAARTRQLSHRLKGRRAAILERRAEGGSGTPAKAGAQVTTTAPSLASSGGGFTAVNSASSRPSGESEAALGSNTAVRNELLRHFEGLPHNQSHSRAQPRQQSIAIPEGSQIHKQSDSHREPGRADSTASSLSPVPTNPLANDALSYYVTDTPPVSRQAGASGHRPSSSTSSQAVGQAPYKHNFSRPLPPALESSQPFRPLCQAHMDSLSRGQRVLPPCDRCRRLRMDCVKNLTSCAGCTKKHARCHWREVTRDELGALDHLMETAFAAGGHSPDNAGHMNGYTNGSGDYSSQHHPDDSEDDGGDDDPLEDLEALGEKAEREQEAAAEQMREDEEGLQHAKDLARQGLQENMRSAQQPPINEEEGQPDNRHEDMNNPEASTTPIPITNGDNEHAHDNIDDDELALSKAAPTTELLELESRPEEARATSEEVQNFGGFRAVNESLAGWRPS